MGRIYEEKDVDVPLGKCLKSEGMLAARQSDPAPWENVAAAPVHHVLCGFQTAITRISTCFCTYVQITITSNHGINNIQPFRPTPPPDPHPTGTLGRFGSSAFKRFNRLLSSTVCRKIVPIGYWRMAIEGWMPRALKNRRCRNGHRWAAWRVQ